MTSYRLRKGNVPPSQIVVILKKITDSFCMFLFLVVVTVLIVIVAIVASLILPIKLFLSDDI